MPKRGSLSALLATRKAGTQVWVCFDSRFTKAVQGVEHLASKWCRNVLSRFAGRGVRGQRDRGAGYVRFLEPESSILVEDGVQLFVFLL